MNVFIESIPNKFSAYGVHKIADPTTGQPLEKSKYGRTLDRMCALYSSKVGGLKNGLSYKPWLDDNGQQKTNTQGKLLTLQDREEQKWNLETGYLTNRAWRLGDSKKESDRTYYQTKYWKLQDGSTCLDITNNFDDAMFYYVALDSKYIANSGKELRSNKWPFATHFISLTNESEEHTYEKNRRKIKAYAALGDPSFISVWKERFLHILEISSSLNSLTEEKVENALTKFIDGDNGTVGHNISKFLAMYEMLSTDEGRKELEAKHLLRKGLDTRVIYEKSDTYTWNRAKGKVVLGDRYEDAISFILNPKKDTLVEELEAEIKSKLI